MYQETAKKIPIRRWILVPSLVTLAITILRLVGELNHWPEAFFGRAAGGGAAIVGIVWLIPIFGAYFGWKLVKSGHRPKSVLKTILVTLAAFAVMVAFAFVATSMPASFVPQLLVITVGSMIAGCVAYLAWPVMGRIQLAYGLAARIPVAIVMLVAIYGDWGTHYDAPPPGGLPGMGPFLKWVLIGLIPQLTTWIAFTILVAALFGAIAAAFARQAKGSPQGFSVM